MRITADTVIEECAELIPGQFMGDFDEDVNVTRIIVAVGQKEVIEEYRDVDGLVIHAAQRMLKPVKALFDRGNDV